MKLVVIFGSYISMLKIFIAIHKMPRGKIMSANVFSWIHGVLLFPEIESLSKQRRFLKMVNVHTSYL